MTNKIRYGAVLIWAFMHGNPGKLNGPLDRKEDAWQPRESFFNPAYDQAGMDENYRAYPIRFRRRETHSGWCASPENVHTHETCTFATERELLVHLLQSLSEKSITPVPGAYAQKGENHENH